jgi:hypothetical protein
VDWSSETKKKWDKSRETLIKTIESETKKYARMFKKYKGENYQSARTELQAAGFTNIKIYVLDDLVNGWWTKDGEVEKVSVNGITDFNVATNFSKDAEIVITYHTFPAP